MREAGAIVDEPLQALAEPRQAREHVVFEDAAHEQRNDADHRTDAQRQQLPIEVQLDRSRSRPSRPRARRRRRVFIASEIAT